MNTEKQIDFNDLVSGAYLTMFEHIFGGNPNHEKPINPYESLNDGYELRPIELSDKQQKDDRIVKLKYSQLYKDGVKISDDIFRKGGLCNGFKDGYCELIKYERKETSLDGFDTGSHVIVNGDGKVCLTNNGLDYPYHMGGHLGSLGGYYYNLLTGEKICVRPSNTVNGKNFLIIENRYNFDYYEVKLPVGVYKLDKITLELIKIDEIK